MSQNRESTELIVGTVLPPVTNIKSLFPCCFKTGDGCQIHHFSSVAQSCPTLCNSMDCSMPGFTTIANSQSFLKLMSIESVMPSNYLILCHPLLLLLIFPSIRIFSNESVLHIRQPNCCSFSISLSNVYSGCISFSIDWIDLIANQGTLKHLLQNHNSKASLIWCSAFFMVQVSHPHMTTGKTQL